MTSKNSLWKISLHNLKERIPMAVLCLLACFFTIFVPTLVAINEIEYWEYDSSIMAQHISRACEYLTPVNSAGLIVLVMFLAIVMGVNAWSWNNSIKKVDFYKSLPVREKSRWIYINVNSIIIFLISYAVNILLSVVALVAKGCWSAGYGAPILVGIVMCLTLYTAVYMLTLIAQQLTGGPMLAAALAIYLNAIEWIVIQGIDALKDVFYETYIYIDGTYSGFLTPVSILLKNISYAGQIRCADMWRMIAALIVQTICYGGIAYYLYKKRESCAGNNNIAFNKTKPVLKIAVMIPGLIACAILFNEFDIMLFGFVCGIVVLQIACQWILEGDFKCILKGKPTLIVSVLAAGGILAIFLFDITGYDKYVPVTEDVQYAAVAFDSEIYRYEYNVDRDDYMRITEKKYIEEIAELVKKYVNNKPEKTDIYESSSRMFVAVTDNKGKTHKRLYEISTEDAYELCCNMYDSEEYRKYTKELLDDGMEELFNNDNVMLRADYYQLRDNLDSRYDNVTLTLRAEEVEQIWQCFMADIEARTGEKIKNSAVIGEFEIQGEIKNELGYGIWENRDFVVYECDERLSDFLRSCSETYINEIDDDVLYAEIRRYGIEEGERDSLVCRITSDDTVFNNVIRNVLPGRYVESDTCIGLAGDHYYYITLYMKDGKMYDVVPIRKNVVDKDGTMIYSN